MIKAMRQNHSLCLLVKATRQSDLLRLLLLLLLLLSLLLMGNIISKFI